MKNYLVIIFCLLTNSLLAQDNSSILTVSGESRLMVTPDITVINIEINSTNLDYSQAIKDLQKKAEDIKSFLNNKGITTKYVKSENFQIDKSYSFDKGVRKYEGYSAKLLIRLEFLNNNDLANKIINAIGSANTDADININFEISLTKQDSINNKLIESAINDAKIKAELISKATDQKILKIDKINYGVRDNVILENSNDMALYSVNNEMSANQNKVFSITPKDIEKNTHIIIVWQLVKK